MQQADAYESDTIKMLIIKDYSYLIWCFILKNKKDETLFQESGTDHKH